MALGNILQEARMRKKLTASEVAAATRMKIQLVQAIEQEDFSAFPATIYGKGFIKLFAEYVDIDPTPLIEEYVSVVSSGKVTQPAPAPIRKPRKILINTEPPADDSIKDKKTTKEQSPVEAELPLKEGKKGSKPENDKPPVEDLFSRIEPENKQPEKKLFHPDTKPIPAIVPEPIEEPIQEKAPTTITEPEPIKESDPIKEENPFKEELVPDKEATPLPEDRKPLYAQKQNKEENQPAVQSSTIPQNVISEEPVPTPEPVREEPKVVPIFEPEPKKQQIEPDMEPIPVISQVPLTSTPAPIEKETKTAPGTVPMKKRAADASLSLKKLNLSESHIKAASISAGILILLIIMTSTISRCSRHKKEEIVPTANETLQLAIPPADPYLE